MGATYSGGATVGNSFQGWDTVGMVQLTDPDGDGIYVGSMNLPAGTDLEYKFIQGYNGGGAWETVPDECGKTTGIYVNRHLVMGVEDTTLETVPYGGCAGSLPPEPSDTICGDAPGRSVPVTTEGYTVKLGEVPLHMKGVCWSPFPVGASPGGSATIFANAVTLDAPLMAAAGINVVRTYGPIPDTAVLDELWANGIHVIMTIYYGYSDTVESALANLCALKSHPAIIAWAVGNEWNYSNLDKGIGFEEAVSEVATVIQALKANDSTRLTSTVYGHLPSSSVLSQLDAVDLWGLNVYTGVSFWGLFEEWSALSSKPFYFGEYGADAYNGTLSAEDPDQQADIVESLTLEIHQNSSVLPGGVCAGGMIFEFNDEWWKNGDPWSHSTESSWQNGAYPDPNIYEEWWGLVEIDRTPREAYYRYQSLTPPTP